MQEKEDINKNECAPVVFEAENKHHSADFNCNLCGQTDCFYWHLYNNYENPPKINN
ncbi:MAG: hypothetical protein LUE64_04875 [Candidatus Gastranaerophilales bacterium]|nr:hypothetical protein [Candidatus Gastranaerophilales bacterium]